MLGAARTIYVDVGFPSTNFLGAHQLLNTLCRANTRNTLDNCREVELVAPVITFNTNIRKLTGETHIMHAYDIENKTNQTASGCWYGYITIHQRVEIWPGVITRY